MMAGTSTTRLREQVVQGRASLCLHSCIHPIKAEYRERGRELGRQESALDYWVTLGKWLNPSEPQFSLCHGNKDLTPSASDLL